MNSRLWYSDLCEAECIIDRCRYTGLYVTQSEIENIVDTLIYMEHNMKDSIVKIHWSTGNTEWSQERCRYTDVQVTQSEA
jgi:hypothetical protein